jgi:hypothetical protein
MDAGPEGHHPLLVPVSLSPSGSLVLLTGRLASGERVGLAFTSEESLRAVLGPWQQWTRLSEDALHGMLTPIGVQHVRVDSHPGRHPAHAAPGSRTAA